MRNFLLMFSLSVVLIVTACQKQPVMQTTPIYPMDGEWRVKIYNVTADTQVYGVLITFTDTSTIPTNKGQGILDTMYPKVFTMLTANTASNDKDSLVIKTFSVTYKDTFPNQKDAKAKTIVPSIIGKVYCSVAEKIFSITDGVLHNADGTIIASPNLFTISGGKIMLNAAHPPSGTKADSIVFFIDKRGSSTTKYRVEGFRRTFWPDDESW